MPSIFYSEVYVAPQYQRCSSIGQKLLTQSTFLSWYETAVFDLECLEFLYQQEPTTDFLLGNCLKYLWRCGQKSLSKLLLHRNNAIAKDLLKAQNYLSLYISYRQEETNSVMLPSWILLLNLSLMDIKSRIETFNESLFNRCFKDIRNELNLCLLNTKKVIKKQ